MQRWIVVGLAVAIALVLPLQSAYAQEETGKKEVVLIKGLDGGTYEPYSPALIEKVQSALNAEGLYQGQVNGALDEDTMNAIGEFQKRNQLTVSGVPSPNTRRSLLKE